MKIAAIIKNGKVIVTGPRDILEESYTGPGHIQNVSNIITTRNVIVGNAHKAIVQESRRLASPSTRQSVNWYG